MGLFQEAIKCCQNGIQQCTSYYPIKLQLAKIYIETDQLNLADQIINNCIYEHTSLFIVKAYLALIRNQLNNANEFIDKALQQESNSEEANYFKAKILFQQQEFKQSLNFINISLKQNEKQQKQQQLELKLQILLQEGDFVEIIKCAKLANGFLYELYQGIEFSYQHQFEKALFHLQRASKLSDSEHMLICKFQVEMLLGYNLNTQELNHKKLKESQKQIILKQIKLNKSFQNLITKFDSRQKYHINSFQNQQQFLISQNNLNDLLIIRTQIYLKMMNPQQWRTIELQIDEIMNQIQKIFQQLSLIEQQSNEFFINHKIIKETINQINQNTQKKYKYFQTFYSIIILYFYKDQQILINELVAQHLFKYFNLNYEELDKILSITFKSNQNDLNLIFFSSNVQILDLIICQLLINLQRQYNNNEIQRNLNFILSIQSLDNETKNDLEIFEAYEDAIGTLNYLKNKEYDKDQLINKENQLIKYIQNKDYYKEMLIIQNDNCKCCLVM